MAATDGRHRSPGKLDLFFGLCCCAILLVTLLMLYRDFRPSSQSARNPFRQVEATVVERDLVKQMPEPDQIRMLRIQNRQAKEAMEDARAATILGPQKVEEYRDLLRSKVSRESKSGREARSKLDGAVAEFEEKQRRYSAQQAKAEEQYRAIKADLDEQINRFTSEKDLAAKSGPNEAKSHEQRVQELKGQIASLESRLEEAKRQLDQANLLVEKEIRQPVEAASKLLALAEEGMKKLTNASDRFSKLAAQNAWSFGAAFPSASKQQGHLLPDLTADKGGSRDGGRHDRCTTCHQGIDRPLHDKATLAKLSDEGEMKRLSSKLAGSMEELEKRQRPGENLNFTPDNLPGKTRGSAALVAFLILACALVASLTLGLLQQSARSGLRVFLAGGLLALGTSAALALFSPRVIGIEPIELSPVQIQQFAAHPRLDLFVDSKSPHAMGKFGCTICHAGQGSATEFHQAGHSPNSSEQLLRWQKEFHGQSGQTANTSMLSNRFIESSCLKCHHQVTDLVRQGVKEEAPKLLKGYELAREHGCFGCHEIQGMKNGRPVGPDMRLEPSPALEWLDSEERQKALSDPSNPPGTYRKVGPSLRRLAEKTNMDWTVQWILDPRGFRADTRMPHFYNLSTNAPGVLPEDQKEFPSAEIQAMSHYLIQESKSFLQGKDNHRQALLEGTGNLPSLQESLIRSGLSEEQWKDLQTKTRQFVDLALLATPRLHESINALFRNQKALQEKLYLLRKSGKPGEAIESEIAQAGKELRDVTSQLIARSVPAPLSAGILDESGQKVTIPTGQGDPVQGRLLFTEKGCLACHAHDATRETYDKDGKKVYGVSSQANFGPDLTRIADKIAPAADQVTSRTWLIQWLLNPNQYHPRTKMPITYLTPAEASDMAAWLLAQKTGWVGAKPEPNQPAVKTYQALARMYLSKAPGMTASEVDQYLPLSGDMPPGIPQDRLNALAPDSEERILQQGKVTLDGLKWYVGKKSLARLGCYGCHDIPGFENHKPVGIGLNDWGRKEGGQLPFEDAEAFVRSHFRMVPDRITRSEAEKRVKILSEKAESELTAEESRELRRLEERLARQQSAKEGETSEPGEKQAEGKESGAAVALSEPFFEAGPGPDGKSLPPLEDFFQISLKNHQREGFLNLKLLEPRAFDFNRSRSWDERLRMPQHRFTRSRKMPEESDSAFAARQEKEEAEAREAVMTFVLGLVGEAVPEEYLPKPGADKKAEAVGLQVLEKFNCASCHQVRPGIYDFKAAEVQSALERSFTLASGENGRNFLSDHLYPGHNSWFGAPASSDQLSAFGYRDTLVTEKAQELEGLGGTVAVRLAEAFRFTNLEKITRDMPQGTYLYLPQNAFHESLPYGGTWTDLMVPYLAKKDSSRFPKDDPGKARTVLPPPLVREGERVQPDWLYKFLLNPVPIRPLFPQSSAGIILRMPKFNLSPEDSQAIVNYFVSVARQGNPGARLTSPQVFIPQKDPEYWQKTGERYEKSLREMLVRVTSEAQAAQPGSDKAKAWETRVKLINQALSRSGSGKSASETYSHQALQLVTHKDLCLKCHSVASIVIDGAQGPNLSLSAERLRPEWLEQWIANPSRLFTYAPVMPQNFPNNPDPLQWTYQDSFVGTPLQQSRAVRDLLMDLPRLTDLLKTHPNKNPPSPGEKK